MYKRLFQFLIVGILFIISCDKERPFEWTAELGVITGKDLKSWLQTAPFEGEWDPAADEDGKFLITNIDQVFPFLGKFENADDNFDADHNNSDIFSKQTIIFKDPIWGESFVHAVLLYEPEELFLNDYYSEMGNVVFSGADAINESYTARLTETMLYKNNAQYKTGIYWVSANYQTYLMGFYQKGKLVLQFAFPCKEKGDGLMKIKEVNQVLGLNISEWSKATVAELEVNPTPVSFWKDPYYPLYTSQMLPDLQVKINTTPFEMSVYRIAADYGVDYLFSYDNEAGNYTLSFLREATDLDQVQYEKAKADLKSIPIENDNGRVYIVDKTAADGHIHLKAETYLRDNKFVKIVAEYPISDSSAENQVQEILNSLRIRRF